MWGRAPSPVQAEQGSAGFSVFSETRTLWKIRASAPRKPSKISRNAPAYPYTGLSRMGRDGLGPAVTLSPFDHNNHIIFNTLLYRL